MATRQDGDQTWCGIIEEWRQWSRAMIPRPASRSPVVARYGYWGRVPAGAGAGPGRGAALYTGGRARGRRKPAHPPRHPLGTATQETGLPPHPTQGRTAHVPGIFISVSPQYTTIFIVNLAWADFLYCVVNLPLYSYNVNTAAKLSPVK